MRMRLVASVALALQAIPAAVLGVTLSGAMIYSTDHYGNPNAWNAQKEEFALGQVWRTQLGGDWFGLGLLAGLPPANSDAPVLNSSNFGIEVSLMEGENDFTVVGEPSVLTRNEEFSHFALNLYFDGVLDRPGISVLFPRYSPRRGSPPLPNVAPVTYALSLAGIRAPAQATYTDGVDRVSVIAVSFLPPERFGADYDKVSAHAVLPSSASPGPGGSGADGWGGFDYVGVLRINVEALGNAVAPGAPAVPVPQVVMPGVVVGQSVGGDAGTVTGTVTGETPSADGHGASASVGDTSVDDPGTTPTVVQTPTPGGTAVRAETAPTKAATALATGAATKPLVTPTPAATQASGPLRAGQTPTIPKGSPAPTERRPEPTAVHDGV